MIFHIKTHRGKVRVFLINSIKFKITTVIICVVGHGILLVRTESSAITKKTFAMFIFSTCIHNGYNNHNAYICMHA